MTVTVFNRRTVPVNNPALRTARYIALTCGIIYGVKRNRELTAYEAVYQEDQTRIKMALKRINKDIAWLKYYDEMNELAYDLGVPNRVVQADRAKDPQFAPED